MTRSTMSQTMNCPLCKIAHVAVICECPNTIDNRDVAAMAEEAKVWRRRWPRGCRVVCSLDRSRDGESAPITEASWAWVESEDISTAAILRKDGNASCSGLVLNQKDAVRPIDPRCCVRVRPLRASGRSAGAGWGIVARNAEQSH